MASSLKHDNVEKESERNAKLFETWKKLNVYCGSWEVSKEIFEKRFLPQMVKEQVVSMQRFVPEPQDSKPKESSLPPKKKRFVVDYNDPQLYVPYVPENPSINTEVSVTVQYLLSKLMDSNFQNQFHAKKF